MFELFTLFISGRELNKLNNLYPGELVPAGGSGAPGIM